MGELPDRRAVALAVRAVNISARHVRSDNRSLFNIIYYRALFILFYPTHPFAPRSRGERKPNAVKRPAASAPCSALDTLKFEYFIVAVSSNLQPRKSAARS